MQPGAIDSHPLGREEHLIPLHVIVGCSGGNPGVNLGTIGDEFVMSSFIF